MFRLLLLGNGWAICVEIWYAIGIPLVAVYAVVTGRAGEMIPEVGGLGSGGPRGKGSLSVSKKRVLSRSLVITSEREARSEFLLIYTKNLSLSGRPAGRPWSRF